MSPQTQESEYKASIAEERLTDEIKFSYSWHLIKSRYRKDIRKGIKLMEGMCYIVSGISIVYNDQ